MKKLQTLTEFNSDRWALHLSTSNRNQPVLNGIACPQCGKELMDSNPAMTLTSNPPKKNVKCSKCDYRGYRIA